MARGGRREANGKANPNRTDLNAPKPVPVARFTDQEYGQQAQQVASQQQVPITAPAIPPVTPLDAPTTRPQEPVTHGLPSGPGAGPEALGLGGDDHLAAMRAALSMYPDPDLMRAILDEEERRSG